MCQGIRVKVMLIFISIILRRVDNKTNVRESDRVFLNKNSVEKFKLSAFDLLEHKTTSHGDLLWCCLDNLKQWKKRRRVNCAAKIRSKIEKIRKKRLSKEYSGNTSSLLAIKDVQKHMHSLEYKFKQQWPVHLWHRYGLYTDDYVYSINPHWLQFPPPVPALQYTLGGLYITLAIIGGSGNVFVIIMYLKCRSLRTPGNILVANLALSDLLMLAKTPVFIFNSFNLGPALGKTGCILYGFIGGLTGTTSIATLSAIALDRYWAVVRPLEPLRALTAIRARLLAVGSWVYAGAFALIPALDIGYGRYVPEGYLTSCSFDYLTEEMPPRYFIFIFFCAAWVAPFCTISFCYSKILQIVVFQRNMSTKHDVENMSSRHVKEQTKRKAEIKLAGLVIVVIVLFFLSWTPYAIVALLGIFGKKELISPVVSMVPALFCKTAACINPFIYIISHPKFRKELQKLLFADKSKRMNSTIRTKTFNESSKVHRPSKDLSETDVEIIEMKDIPYHTRDSAKKNGNNIETISSKVSGRGGSQRSVSMKSFEENVVTPPSWYAKPKFAKKKSFTRQSSFI